MCRLRPDPGYAAQLPLWLRRTVVSALLMLAWLACTPSPAIAATAEQSALFSPQELAWIAAHPVLRVGVDSTLRPLEYIENGKFKGLTADYLAAVGAISGLLFETVPVPLDQAAEALEKRSIDLLPAISPALTPIEVRRNLIISPPYFAAGTTVITCAYGEMIFDSRKLNGKTIALKGGGMYEKLLRQNYPAINVHIFDTQLEALDDVAAGKADAVIGMDAILLPIVHDRYRDTLNVSGTLPDAPAVLSIGTHKQWPELAAIVKKSLAAITAKQTDAIDSRWTARNNYGPPSWAQILRHRWFESCLIAVALLSLVLAAQRSRRARRAAEQSEQDKARFLAVMSHEIRTPMNAILSSIELLARSKLTPQQRQLSDLASTASEALLELLDDVLDLSKLEARRLTLAKVPTDLRQLASGVVDIAALQARTKNLDIVLKVDLPEATDLLLDPARIRQILVNLTSNAVKFTERGVVQVSVSLEQPEANALSDSAEADDPASVTRSANAATAATLLLVVSDTGIGVPVERQKDLFRAYHQAHRTSTRRFGGTGLGLAICRELCELMQGEIRFDSSAGVGSTVTCRIPVELAPAQTIALDEIEIDIDTDAGLAAQQAAAIGAANAIAGQTPHILVVEDHPGNRMVLRQQLTQLGYRFTIVEDGLGALEQTARNTFALMLLDCYLPDIDGYTVASRQRAREREQERGGAGSSHLPIIAISAAVDQEHLDACIRSGMDGTLRKPLRLAALENLLNGWCGPGQPPSPVASALQEPQNPSPDSINSRAPRTDSTDLAAIFLKTTRDDLATLELAIRQQAYDQAARLAHRMHGAALVCKWPHVAGHSLTIEQQLKGAADLGKVADAIAQLHLALASDASK
jgi:two-component system sensor histidine kinase EvgS